MIFSIVLNFLLVIFIIGTLTPYSRSYVENKFYGVIGLIVFIAIQYVFHSCFQNNETNHLIATWLLNIIMIGILVSIYRKN